LRPREDETLSEIDQVLLHIIKERRVDLALEACPGYPQGIHSYNGKQILVKTSPRLVKPEKGDWSTIKQLIDGTLNFATAEDPDQTPYFHGWNKTSIESLYAGPGNLRPGQAVILAGPPDSGKSRLQHQILPDYSAAGARILGRICSARPISTVNGWRANTSSWRILRHLRRSKTA